MFIYFQPIYLQQLGASTMTIATVFSAFGLAMMLAHIPAGYLADRIGRKPIIVAAWTSGLIATWVMATGPVAACFHRRYAALRADRFRLRAVELLRDRGAWKTFPGARHDFDVGRFQPGCGARTDLRRLAWGAISACGRSTWSRPVSLSFRPASCSSSVPSRAMNMTLPHLRPNFGRIRASSRWWGSCSWRCSSCTCRSR